MYCDLLRGLVFADWYVWLLVVWELNWIDGAVLLIVWMGS